MGVHCKILIRKPREGVHKAGQPVDGIVTYAIDQPTEYRNINVSLIGHGRCSWTVTSAGKDNKSRTYIGTENYVSQHIHIFNQPNNTITISPGSYDFPFQFILPLNIPPSIKNSTCKISYYIEVKFAKPSFFSFTRVFKTELTVYNYVSPMYHDGPTIFGLEKSLFKLFTENPKINLKAEIDNSFYAPGENAKLTVVVTNDTDVAVKSVITTLRCHTIYTADCGETTDRMDVLKESLTEFCGLTEKLTTMSRIVPILPDLYTVQNSKIMQRNYSVLVTLRLPMPHINAHVDMPIVIGERGPVEMPVQDLPDDEPPSYWEAVCEEEKIKE